MAKKGQPQSTKLEINTVKKLDEKLSKAIKDSKNKPSDEEVKEAQEKFEEASKNFSIKSWNIGESKDAQAHIDYLNHFVANRLFWTKNGWMGVIKIDEELTDAENFIKTNTNSPLKLGYQAIEFIFYSLQNPGGIGLQAAKDFEGENKLYAKMFDAIGDQVKEARKELKEIQILQDQYGAMAQGFYLEIEPEINKNEENQQEKSKEEKK